MFLPAVKRSARHVGPSEHGQSCLLVNMGEPLQMEAGGDSPYQQSKKVLAKTRAAALPPNRLSGGVPYLKFQQNPRIHWELVFSTNLGFAAETKKRLANLAFQVKQSRFPMESQESQDFPGRTNNPRISNPPDFCQQLFDSWVSHVLVGSKDSKT